MTDPEVAAADYARAFPNYPPLAVHGEWVYGIWEIGANYRATNPIYGAYPPSYLRRVHSMFRSAQRVLHLFSGGLTQKAAMRELRAVTDKFEIRSGRDVVTYPEIDMALVDSKGPDEGRYPTHQREVTDLPPWWDGFFDLVLCDPPYSAADCELYGVKPVRNADVMREAARVTKPGGNLVWLDQKRPMFRKDMWRLWGAIGLVRSTNHRVRLVSIFERHDATK